MWYGATGSYLGEVHVGYAINADGLGDWTKVAGPLPGLEPGAPGAWDDLGLAPSTVCFDDGAYRMWYTAVKNEVLPWGTWRIGHASSTDGGIGWSKHPDPVLVGSEPWEGNHVYVPKVVPNNQGFAMWYTAATDEAAIGYAVSPDGLNWGRWPANPVLAPVSPCLEVYSLKVILEGDVAHGWFGRCGDIVYATSPRDVVHFDGFESGDTSVWNATVP
jgi:predicted GH43/DUF377 family glycosyl hydrolase